ncbi:MAG: 30S ribosomal protein S8 [Candidatus Omnitrophica bacterium]|nr:MAG: 30S ribosomal protein S8 [Candidatus Hinthialibacteria bacterium OLB16]MBE7488558.1 30S ribosomal protein S8 [bacterium]MBK7495799.1 30S ribosomal protein S8 [Candidatus Omnitrophota bacterium]MCE7908154.1 30S ribosomal protein S8 [Candidatus Omnitrophica bacterium COP1]MBW7939261.1 30S ribosomal protein S8 [Candidatus Omnitrophota bacterium]
MSMTDPIADFLTRIRNANTVSKDRVEMPSSKLKRSLANILKQEGFIRNYRYLDNKKQGILRIYLKYGENGEKVISRLERVSKPSVRIYVGKEDIPRVQGGIGVVILSTNQGVMSGKQARKLGIGGEVLCRIW